jgi:hypothetical protein
MDKNKRTKETNIIRDKNKGTGRCGSRGRVPAL